MKRKRPLSTNERLIASLDLIRYELDRMGVAILDARDVAEADRAKVRRAVAHLARRTDALVAWLAETRADGERRKRT